MHTFPKSARLLTSRDYQKVCKKGLYLSGKYITITILKSSDSVRSKLGMSVPKQFGKAHVRNQFKRRLRELFRRTSFSEACSLHIKPRLPANEMTFSQLSEEYHHLLKQMISSILDGKHVTSR